MQQAGGEELNNYCIIKQEITQKDKEPNNFK